MEGHLENIEKLIKAKATLIETMGDEFVLTVLMEAIENQIFEERKAHKRKQIKECEGLSEFKGKLPDILEQRKTELDYAKLGNVLYAWERKERNEYPLVIIQSYIWMPLEGQKSSSYILVKADCLRREKKHQNEVRESEDSWNITLHFCKKVQNEWIEYGSNKPTEQELSRYHDYLTQLIHLLRNGKMAGFHPVTRTIHGEGN